MGITRYVCSVGDELRNLDELFDRNVTDEIVSINPKVSKGSKNYIIIVEEEG